MAEIYFAEFSKLFFMNFLNLASPGPETALMIHNSSHYSKKIGIYTGMGIVLSTLIHKAYSILGFGRIVSQSPLLFNSLKYLGCSYLVYLGIKMFLAPNQQLATNSPYITHFKTLTPKRALRMGFTIDILHPQASLTFISIFASCVSTTTPFGIQALYGLLLALSSLIWYTLLATTSSQKHVKDFIHRWKGWINKSMGAYMLYFAYQLASRTL